MRRLTTSSASSPRLRRLSCTASISPWRETSGFHDVSAPRRAPTFVTITSSCEYGCKAWRMIWLVTHHDPVEDLRQGWNLHIDFGLANPALYTLMYGNPRPGTPHPAAAELQDALLGQVRRIAEAGRLCVGVERAADMIHAAAVGVVLVLLGQGGARGDQTLAVATREAVLAAITTDPQTVSPHARPASRSDVTRHAVALKASLSQDAGPFTTAERALFSEWLSRFIDTEP